jgi:hypothetical protein
VRGFKYLHASQQRRKRRNEADWTPRPTRGSHQPNPEVNTMKLIQSLLVAAVVAVPVALPAAAFAQSNAPLTRAQVRAELVQLEKSGYNPAADYTQYPQNIQAALARESAKNGADAAAASAYGGAANASAGSVDKGASLSPSAGQDVVGLGPIYAHS